MDEISEAEYADSHGGSYDEPEGGWQEGPKLWTQPLITVTLCRYSGIVFPSDGSGICLERENRQHPAVPCWEQFHSAMAITNALVVESPLAVREVRYGPAGATGVGL